ncbi:MAG: hypothetical protein ACRCUY_09225 [Thermoguttaceae bacterium]
MKQIFCLSLVVCCAYTFIGCHMADRSRDFCSSAHICRPDDYRGCDPLYRAGSIFYPNGDASAEFQQTAWQRPNAGNYGETVPITLKSYGRTPDELRDTQSIEVEPEYVVPSFDDMLKNTPDTIIYPKTEQKSKSKSDDDGLLPESFNDQLLNEKTSLFSTDEPTFSIDELQKLDPSVTEIKILKVEDTVR